MNNEAEKLNRRSIRLPGYDYSQPGAYFVTICTQNRACLYGDIIDGKMQLNGLGIAVRSCWEEIPMHFGNVSLDVQAVMPNHMHGIIILEEMLIVHGVGAGLPRPYMGGRPTLGRVVAYYKYQSTKHINEIRATPGAPIWQRNYYEHVVRNEDDLNEIRQYIENNPTKWLEDENHPKNIRRKL